MKISVLYRYPCNCIGKLSHVDRYSIFCCDHTSMSKISVHGTLYSSLQAGLPNISTKSLGQLILMKHACNIRVGASPACRERKSQAKIEGG